MRSAEPADARSSHERVRVRFAPSPTGMFHVGGARSALQNWIFAKQHGGTFVLRIEDTDASRNRPEWIEGILSALDWIGIERGSYEGPYFQSAYAEAHTRGRRRAVRGRQGVLLRLHARGRGPAGEPARGSRVRRVLPRPRPGPRREAGAAIPYPRRGRDDGRRPDPGRADVRQHAHRGLRHRPGRRLGGVPARQRRRRHDHEDHACDPGRGAPAEHAEAAAALGGAGSDSAGVGARAGGGQREAAEAVQAPRQGGAGGVPRRGLPGRRRCATT